MMMEFGFSGNGAESCGSYLYWKGLYVFYIFN